MKTQIIANSARLPLRCPCSHLGKQASPSLRRLGFSLFCSLAPGVAAAPTFCPERTSLAPVIETVLLARPGRLALPAEADLTSTFPL